MKHKLCLFNNRDINACSIDLLLACFCSKWSSTKWHKCILLTCFWHVSVQNHHQRNASMGSMDFVAENGTIKIIVPIYFWWAWTFHAFEESHLHEGFHILRFFFMIIPILRLVPCCRHKVQFQIQKAWCTTEGVAWQVTVYSLLLPKFCVHSDSHWRHFFSMVYQF